MNSVMNKLFEEKNEHFDSLEMDKCDVHIDTMEPSDAVNDIQMEQTEEVPEEGLDDLQKEETEEPSDEDFDDGLVINIVPRKSNKSVVQVETEKQAVNRDSQSRKCPRFEEPSLPKKRQRSEASSEPRKRKLEPVSVIPDTRSTFKSLPAPEVSQNQQKSPGLTGKVTYE